MTERGRFTIGANHPSLPGHFPGRPIVPGVLLLNEVLASLSEGATLVTAKFTAPVFPGVEVVVQGRDDPGGRTAFTCIAGGQTVLSGTAALR